MSYPTPLLNLATLLRRLPGVGAKTAERFAFHLLGWPEQHLEKLAEAIATLHEKIHACPECHALLSEGPCTFCDPTKRDSKLLCIVSSAKELYALEETRSYRGLYHVLGSLLSPLDGRGPEHLDLSSIVKRVQNHKVEEVIIALDSTLEGDATALYLKEKLAEFNIPVSRLAFGLPMGSPLEYVDGGTLSRALTGRQNFS